MLEKIKEAFEPYKKMMEQEISTLLNKGAQAPCDACAKNIERIQSHAQYNPNKPIALTIEAEDKFELDYDHLTTLSEHSGMPCMTSHDFCPTCYTNFYYEFGGHDDGPTYRFQQESLSEIEDIQHFLNHQKILYFQRFAPYLNDYFQGKKGDVILYISLDENLRRSNHDYLVSYYTKEGKSLEKLNEVIAFLSGNEMLANGRIGNLFLKEFLQKISYPMECVTFEFSSYFERIHVNIDVKQIKERSFFDVYTKKFVSFDSVDLKNIHMIKRNEDTYALCSERKKDLGLDGLTSYNEIIELFKNSFKVFEKEILLEKFGSAYEEYVKTKEENDKAFELGMQELRKGMTAYLEERWQKSQERPTLLNGFQAYDNVLSKEGLYQGMKACVKEIDFDKKTLGVVFFGETNFDNVVHLNPDICEKI